MRDSRRVITPSMRRTMKALKRAIEQIDSRDEHKRQSQIALVLITAIASGTDVPLLAAHTGYPGEFISEISQRMQAARLWQGGEASCEGWWNDEDDLTPIFWGHVLVADGQITGDEFWGGAP